MKRWWLYLLIIIFLGSCLRLYKLGEVPGHPDWDEVSIGYNAYSILSTGMDEYGQYLPLTFRSFNDYKPPLYIYLAAVPIFFFGLSVWAVRSVSAISGILTILGTYLLVINMYDETDYNLQKGIFHSLKIKSSSIALVTSFLLAISPWHIQFSRIAFEANLALSFIVWGAAFFFISLKKPFFFPISAFFFTLSLWVYHTPRVFTPILVVILLLTYKSLIFKKENFKYLVVTVMIFLVGLTVFVYTIFVTDALARAGGTSSFSNPIALLGRSSKKVMEDMSRADIIGAILDNRRFVYIKTVIDGYLSHFSLKWLFLTGDNPRHHAPDFGLLYLWEMPFWLYGFYVLFKNKNRFRNIVVAWYLLSPVAAAPTTGLPHAVRAIEFIPVIQIITALGVISAYGKLCSIMRYFRFIFITLICSIFVITFFRYLNLYFIHTDQEFAHFWQYGYKQAVDYTEKIKAKYKKIVVSTSLDQPHAFYLFFTKYNPSLYLKNGGTKYNMDNDFTRLDKYEFRPVTAYSETLDGSVLYVLNPKENFLINATYIYYPDGNPAIVIGER